jgi:Flp pilus assembly protein TadG
MQMKNYRFLKDQTGASAVEFAIILPVLLALIFGIIEFGLYLFNQHIMTNAVREAARAGIVVREPTVGRMSNSEITTILQNYLDQRLVTFGSASPVYPTPQRLEVDKTTGIPTGVLLGDGAGAFSDLLTVWVTYQYDFLFLSNLGIGPVTIQAVSQMKFE